MKVILDIPDENLKKLGEIAKSSRQSRKSFMEFILISKSSEPALIYQSPPKEKYDSERITELRQDEVGQWQEPVKPKIRRSFENYQGLLLDCETTDEYVKLKEEIENSDLTTKQKNLLLKR